MSIVHKYKSRAGQSLSPREFEVATLMIEGLSNAAIGKQLGVQGNTVKFHIASIIEKLDARTRTDAAVKFARMIDADARESANRVPLLFDSTVYEM